jgi:phosphoglycolate phosphatase
MKFESVIFDLDGTLLDTIEDIADAVNAALFAFDFPTRTLDEYKYFVGDGMLKLAQRVLPDDVDEDLIAPFLQVIQEQYKKHWDKKTIPYDGIPELLDQLTEKGITFSVLSNKPHEFTILTVARFLKQWKFSTVSGARPGVERKPDPMGALLIAAQLNVQPDAILYVGDTNTDMVTAQRAGMYAVGVTWGFRTRDELRDSGARFIIDHPRELLSHVETIL